MPLTQHSGNLLDVDLCLAIVLQYLQHILLTAQRHLHIHVRGSSTRWGAITLLLIFGGKYSHYLEGPVYYVQVQF